MRTPDSLSAILDDVCQGLPSGRAKLFRLYAAGVSAKLLQSDYALNVLSALAGQSDTQTTTDTTTPALPTSRRVEFYVDSFFAFLYSAFDILAQALDQRFQLIEDERSVSFKHFSAKAATSLPATAFSLTCAKVRRTTYFRNLDRYRNCSTHRRPIYIQIREERVDGTPGYDLAGHLVRTTRLICDNPLQPKPRTEQERELIGYCTKMREKVGNMLEEIAQAAKDHPHGP